MPVTTETIVIDSALAQLHAELASTMRHTTQDEIRNEITRQGLVDTGTLRNRTHVTTQRLGPQQSEQVIVMPEYGEYLELGTPHISPRRFVRNGLERASTEVADRIRPQERA